MELSHGIRDLDHHAAGAARDSVGSQPASKRDDGSRLAEGGARSVLGGAGS